MVSFDGTATGTGLRAPQLRYTQDPSGNKMTWSMAIEYTQPTFIAPDTLEGELLQILPDATSRFSFTTEKFGFRIAVIANLVTGRRINTGEIEQVPVFGGTFAARLKVWEGGTAFFSISGGQGIARYIDMFSSINADIAFNPRSVRFDVLPVFASYLSLEQKLSKSINMTAGAGYARIWNNDYLSDDSFEFAYDLLLNVFWNPIPGTRFGAEYAFGHRSDFGGASGYAARFSALIIYDF